VVFTTRADHDPRAGAPADLRVHFHVDQFRVTWWSADDFARARAELEDRLRAVAAEVRAH
jgi:hypothetical protein